MSKLVCPAGSTLNGNQCVCIGGYFETNNTCKPCHSVCQTCLGTSTNCTICISGFTYNSSDVNCKCYNTPAGVSPMPSCNICPSICLTCTLATPYYCFTCDSSLYRVYDRFTSSCVCMDGYFQNSSNLCQICDATCRTCLNASVCLECWEI